MSNHSEAERQKPLQTDHACDDAGACPLVVDRRRFLRDTALTVIASLAATGAAPAPGLAERIRALAPVRATAATRSYPIPPSDGVSVDTASDVILARWQGRVYAFSQRCPHRGARLEWHPDEARVFCPKHRARFRPDGSHASGRGTRPLDRYALVRRGGSIVVDLNTRYRADQDPAAWAGAVAALA